MPGFLLLTVLFTLLLTLLENVMPGLAVGGGAADGDRKRLRASRTGAAHEVSAKSARISSPFLTSSSKLSGSPRLRLLVSPSTLPAGMVVASSLITCAIGDKPQ